MMKKSATSCLCMAMAAASLDPSVLAQRTDTADARVRRIGYLGLRPIEEARSTIDALKEGLRELGHVEGRDYALEIRLADNDPRRYPALIGELTALNVDLIVAASTPAAVAILRASPAMPVVVGRGPDLVGAGLARSADRPGGLITGFEELNEGTTEKSLRILKEAAPAAARVAVLSPAPTPDAHDRQLAEAHRSAGALGVTLDAHRISATTDFDALFPVVLQQRPQALLVIGGVLPGPVIERIVRFANDQRLPAVYPHELYAQRGGLIAYSMDNEAMFRQAATYVDKILKGANPGELPLTRWTRENLLHVNVGTSQRLGISLPRTLLARAGRVIK